jgi:hypothetical protein
MIFISGVRGASESDNGFVVLRISSFEGSIGVIKFCDVPGVSIIENIVSNLLSISFVKFQLFFVQINPTLFCISPTKKLLIIQYSAYVLMTSSIGMKNVLTKRNEYHE